MNKNIDTLGDFLAEIKTKIYCYHHNKEESELDDTDLLTIGTLDNIWFLMSLNGKMVMFDLLISEVE